VILCYLSMFISTAQRTDKRKVKSGQVSDSQLLHPLDDRPLLTVDRCGGNAPNTSATMALYTFRCEDACRSRVHDSGRLPSATALTHSDLAAAAARSSARTQLFGTSCDLSFERRIAQNRTSSQQQQETLNTGSMAVSVASYDNAEVWGPVLVVLVLVLSNVLAWALNERSWPFRHLLSRAHVPKLLFISNRCVQRLAPALNR